GAARVAPCAAAGRGARGRAGGAAGGGGGGGGGGPRAGRDGRASGTGAISAARLAIVGQRKRSTILSDAWGSVSFRRWCRRSRLSECPPRAKKVSWAPTASRGRTWRHAAANGAAVAFRGATSASAAGAADAGRGSTARSTLPFGLRGSVSRGTKADGTM